MDLRQLISTLRFTHEYTPTIVNCHNYDIFIREIFGTKIKIQILYRNMYFELNKLRIF